MCWHKKNKKYVSWKVSISILWHDFQRLRGFTAVGKATHPLHDWVHYQVISLFTPLSQLLWLYVNDLVVDMIYLIELIVTLLWKHEGTHTRLKPIADVVKLGRVDPMTSRESLIILIGWVSVVYETKIPKTESHEWRVSVGVGGQPVWTREGD